LGVDLEELDGNAPVTPLRDVDGPPGERIEDTLNIVRREDLDKNGQRPRDFGKEPQLHLAASYSLSVRARTLET
jgi:hypothetical protein